MVFATTPTTECHIFAAFGESSFALAATAQGGNAVATRWTPVCLQAGSMAVLLRRPTSVVAALDNLISPGKGWIYLASQLSSEVGPVWPVCTRLSNYHFVASLQPYIHQPSSDSRRVRRASPALEVLEGKGEMVCLHLRSGRRTFRELERAC